MFYCSRLDMHLDYALKRMNLSYIVCCKSAQSLQQEKELLDKVGQAMPLTVIRNSEGKYTLLAGDALYTAMAELRAADKGVSVL